MKKGVKGLEYAVLRQGMFMPEWDDNGYAIWYSCVLVKHPEVGYFLYDAGVGPGDDTFRRPEHHMQYGMLSIPRNEYLDKALPAIGVSLDEIKAIVVSHCHWDHMGGLCFFRGKEAIKNVYVCEDDFREGLFQSHRTAKGYMDPCDFYYRWNFDVEGAEYKMITNDTELFPGVEFRILKGHTKGCMAMILHQENGTVIFTGDTISQRKSYEDPEHNIYFTCTDPEAFLESCRKVREWAKEYNAKLIFPHDEGPAKGYKPHFVR